MKTGKIFEEISFTYQPTAALPPGRHQLYLKFVVSDEHPECTFEKTYNFMVDPRERPEHDDSPEEQDRRRKHQRED